jgi:hypothetical protein
MTMPLRESVARMKAAVAARFPEDAEVVDAQMLDFDDDAYEVWLENFCELTNAAMARRDEATVRAHLSYISQQLNEGDEEVTRAVDVAYAENLMWSLNGEGKRWAWPLVPSNLRQLYLNMWGEPRLDD